jgi:hypothetical protein
MDIDRNHQSVFVHQTALFLKAMTQSNSTLSEKSALTLVHLFRNRRFV